jgi:nanoRNase/pAp phosphatase (c-di-AMP/oligoRNAs hydrolase)
VGLALGGGGHPLAAGCVLDGPLDQAVVRVITLLKEQTSNQQVSDTVNLSTLSRWVEV